MSNYLKNFLDEQGSQNSLQLFTVNQVAKILNVSNSFVYKLVAEGNFPSVKIGSAIRIRLVDLQDFIVNNLEACDDLA